MPRKPRKGSPSECGPTGATVQCVDATLSRATTVEVVPAWPPVSVNARPAGAGEFRRRPRTRGRIRCHISYRTRRCRGCAVGRPRCARVRALTRWRLEGGTHCAGWCSAGSPSPRARRWGRRRRPRTPRPFGRLGYVFSAGARPLHGEAAGHDRRLVEGHACPRGDESIPIDSFASSTAAREYTRSAIWSARLLRTAPDGETVASSRTSRTTRSTRRSTCRAAHARRDSAWSTAAG